MTTIILYGLVGLLLIVSAFKSKEKTKKALKIALLSTKKLLPSIIPMMIFIGIILSVLKPETISLILGERSGFLGVVFGLIIGSIAFLPGFVAFPLGQNLLSHGGGYPQIAAFVSSLMSVGFVSLGMEIKYFGKKSAILRNLLAVLGSIVFAIIMWRFF